MIGADTSLVEAAAIASRELKEEEEKPETEIILKPETEIVLKPETETILKPEPETPALSTQQPSAELEPAFIHSDDGKSLLQNFLLIHKAAFQHIDLHIKCNKIFYFFYKRYTVSEHEYGQVTK